MKNFIGIRLSSNKSYRDNFLQNSLPGGELNPGLPRDRRGYSPLYYRGLTYIRRFSGKNFLTT